MKLACLHLPGLTRYTHASQLQSRLTTAFLSAKALKQPTPSPTIITAQFHPVYTTGRRDIGRVSQIQQTYLRAANTADFAETLRGGQTTFHGPGQLVAYPILDLRAHRLSPRCYVSLLEQALIDTCGRYGIRAMRTEHTGVWTSEERKIAAVGVHLRRNVTSHGVGLNVSTDLKWFSRIVACGLEGKETTSFEREGVEGVGIEEVGQTFVKELAKGLGIEEIYSIQERDVFDEKNT